MPALCWGSIRIAGLFGAEKGVDAGREDEIVFVKAIDGVREQGDAEPPPAHQQVGMVILPFSDLAEPVCKRKRLSEILHSEIPLQVVIVDQFPVPGYLPSQAFNAVRGKRGNAAFAGDALPPSEIFSANGLVTHSSVPRTM